VDAAFEGVSEEKQARDFLRKKRLVKPKDQKQAARIFRQLARGGLAQDHFHHSEEVGRGRGNFE